MGGGGRMKVREKGGGSVHCAANTWATCGGMVGRMVVWCGMNENCRDEEMLLKGHPS